MNSLNYSINEKNKNNNNNNVKEISGNLLGQIIEQSSLYNYISNDNSINNLKIFKKSKYRNVKKFLSKWFIIII